MKITVLSDFAPPERQLETQSTTLSDFLEELSSEFGMSVGILGSTYREVNPNLFVTLNGQLCSALIDGINTKLQDGDRVAVYGTYLTGGG